MWKGAFFYLNADDFVKIVKWIDLYERGIRLDLEGAVTDVQRKGNESLYKRY